MKKPFFVPITEPLRAVLEDLRRVGGMLFPGSKWVCPGNGVSGFLQNIQDMLT